MRKQIPLPTIPTAPTVETEENIEAKWLQVCARYRLRVGDVNKDLITLYFDMGIQVLEMMKRPDSWGRRTADDLAAKLDMSVSTVRCAAKFAQIIGSQHALKALIDCGLKWTAAVALIQVKEASVRHQLCLEYRDQDMTVEELRARIREIQPDEGDQPKKHGGMNWTTLFRKTSSQTQDLTTTLGEYMDYVAAYEAEEVKSDKANDAYDTSVLSLKRMHDEIGEILEKVDAKTIDI